MVKDLEVSNLLSKSFWAPAYKFEEVESEGVTTLFSKWTNKIELLATSPDSPYRKVLEKKGEGIHHIFDVGKYRGRIIRQKKEGFVVLTLKKEPIISW
jgi:methylmalonyl-CoA/ethylmalonyl-CoA epimerase